MTLLQQQQRFIPLLAKLYLWAIANGYLLTGGELWRPPQQAQWNAAHGAGIVNSLHGEKLAQDLNLFKADAPEVLLSTVDDYRPLGDFWKSLDPDCCWGGDFHSPDADHFSLTWGGVK